MCARPFSRDRGKIDEAEAERLAELIESITLLFIDEVSQGILKLSNNYKPSQDGGEALKLRGIETRLICFIVSN